MEWVKRVVVGGIVDLMDKARVNYGVNPILFLAIYVSSAPFFYYSIYRMVRAIARKRQNELIAFSMVFLGATVAPFLYVMIFGRNLPWWVYGLIAILVGQGVYSLVRTLRKKKSPRKEVKPEPDME